MICPDARPFVISQGVEKADGNLSLSTFCPPCDKWACVACKGRRMRAAAVRLALVAGGAERLWAARMPASRRRTVERAFKRLGQGGRLTVGLAGEERLHIASVDCLTPQHAAKDGSGFRVVHASVDDVVAALRDPALPVVRAPEWHGGWAEEPERPTSRRLFLAVFEKRGERERFCHTFGIDERLLRGNTPLTPEQVEDLAGAVNWWRTTWHGKPQDPSKPWREPPGHGFV
jgi:hypothetical protein